MIVKLLLFVCSVLLVLDTCKSHKILIVCPGNNSVAKTLFGALGEALLKDGKEIMYIPPKPEVFKLRNSKSRFYSKSSDGINYFELDETSIQNYEEKNLHESVRKLSSLLAEEENMRVTKDASAIIVPLLYKDAVGPFFQKNRHMILITVAINSFELYELGEDSGNWFNEDSDLKYYNESKVWDFLSKIRKPSPFPSHLTLINDHHVLTESVHLLPSQVEVPGLHLKPPFMTEELSTFLDGAENGAVYFDLGDDVKSTDMPPSLRKEFLDAFKSLRMRVVWRYEGSGDERRNDQLTMNIQGNSHQSAVLGHANTKVFVSTCDMLGLQRGMYSGVPMFCVPLTRRQERLAALLERKNRGLTFDWKLLDKQIIEYNIEQLSTKRYQDTVQTVSLALKNEPLTSTKKALWNINYVLDKHHLWSFDYPGMHRYAMQMENYDSFLIIAIFVVLVITMVYWVIISYKGLHQLFSLGFYFSVLFMLWVLVSNKFDQYDQSV